MSAAGLNGVPVPELRRCLEIVEWEFVEPVPDVASALTRLAEKYGMEGETCQSDSWTGCQDDELCHSKGRKERHEKNGSQ